MMGIESWDGNFEGLMALFTTLIFYRVGGERCLENKA